MTETDTSREDYGLYDGHCEAGCQHYHGGEIRHHPDCGHYPDSFTKVNADKIASLLARAEKAEAERDVWKKLAGDMADKLNAMTQVHDLGKCYSIAVDVLDMHTEHISALLPSDAAMDRLVAEGQRCDAMTPQEAAKVLLADIISGRDDYARLLKDQPCGGFIGLRASLRAISEDSHE